MRRALSMASDAWRGLGGPDVLLSDAPMTLPYAVGASGSQVVLFAPWPFSPELLAVTATSYDDGSGRILDADILINPAQSLSLLNEHPLEDDEDWDDEGVHRTNYDLGSVLAHEMGHVMGLGESNESPLATMWPRIGRGDTHQRTVEEDDIAGVAEVYEGASLAPVSGCGGARIGAVSRSPILPWILAAIALATGALLTWRRRNRLGASRRGRSAVGAPAGAFFAGAVFLALPQPTPTPTTPPVLRAARALAARGRPPLERRAILQEAVTDEDTSVRVAALSVLSAETFREDLALLAPLLRDPESTISSRARLISALAARAAPEVEQPVLPEDERALRALAEEPTLGTAHILGVHRGDDGMIQTEVELIGEDGVGLLRLTNPGGCLGSTCQQIGESLPAVEGERLIASALTGAWARVSGTRLYDGWVRQGQALQWRTPVPPPALTEDFPSTPQ